jgi:hypothetical protein
MVGEMPLTVLRAAYEARRLFMRTGNLLSAAAMSAVFCVVASGCGNSSSAKTTTESIVPDGGLPEGAAEGATAPGDDSGPDQAAASNDATSSVDAGGTTDTGPDTAPAMEAAATTCAPPLGGDACDTCLAASCCAQLTACDSEPPDADGGETECQDIVNCVGNCTGGDDAGTPQSCALICTQPYGADQAVTDYENLALCQQTTCGSSCN